MVFYIKIGVGLVFFNFYLDFFLFQGRLILSFSRLIKNSFLFWLI